MVLALTVIVAGCGDTTTTTTVGATPTSGTTATSGGTAATTATSGATTTAATTAPAGDQPMFRVGFVGGAFRSLNPFTGGGFAARLVWQTMYGSLGGYDATSQEIKPELAESWTVSPDGLSVTFKVRSGAVWSDGKPITSNDAAFTLNTMVNGLASGATGMWGPQVSSIAKAEAPDAATLVVTLSGPSPQVLAMLCEVPILPEQFWGPLAAGDGSNLKTATMDPSKEDIIVAGPFTIEKLDVQGATLFKRVDTFYGEKPLIVGWGAMTLTNVDAAMTALKNGNIDALAMVPPSATSALTGDPNLVTKGVGTSPAFLVVNYSPKYTAHPELTNVTVRQAMNLAVDRAQICKLVYRDFATPGGFILTAPYAPKFISAAIAPPAFDTAQANSLLDGLGFAKGADGVRVANGVKMEYTVLVEAGLRTIQDGVFGVLKQNFAEIGISLIEKVLDDPYSAFFAGETAYQDNAMMFLDIGTYPDPQGALTYETSRMLGRANFSGYSNPAYDDLYAQQGVAIDPAQRKALIDKMAAMLAEDVVYVGLADFQNIMSWNKAWQNVEDLGGLSAWFDVRNNWSFNRLSKQE
jgi:peptide/nickel transport system substrate-binding protein